MDFGNNEERIAYYERFIITKTRALLRRLERLLSCASDAEDILQETLMKAWTHLEQLRDPEHPERWLFSIADNEARSFMARESRNRRAWESLLPFISDRFDPGLSAEIVERIAYKAASMLTKRQRDYLVYSVMERLSPKQVRAIMKVSESVRSSGLSRAKRRFYKIYKELSEDL